MDARGPMHIEKGIWHNGTRLMQRLTIAMHDEHTVHVYAGLMMQPSSRYSNFSEVRLSNLGQVSEIAVICSPNTPVLVQPMPSRRTIPAGLRLTSTHGSLRR